ncbi:MAG: hypothetical protein K6E84_10210 [Lachnospiraceae bacterium]|nr:hypothetical protein [Lachnospiraceae bacterium]
MLALGYLASFIWMVILPILSGAVLLPFFRRSGKTEGIMTFSFASGLVIHYVIYEVLVLIGGGLDLGMRKVTLIFAAFVLLFSCAGLVILIKNRTVLTGVRPPSPKADPCLWIGVLLVLVQIGAILILATPDLDDAFYSGLSSMSLAQDYLLEKDAYYGLMSKQIESRYILSGLPVYQGALSYLSFGLHPLIIQHNLFPLFYIPLAYALFYRIGAQLMGEKGRRGLFFLLLALVHLVGNYYVFSPENFLVTRLWQGKALFVGIGIPFIYLVCHLAAEKRDRVSATAWILLGAAMIATTFMGETGLYLAPAMVMALMLAIAIVDKRWKLMIGAFCCCLPEAAMLIFLLKGK